MATVFRTGFGQGIEWAIRPFSERDAVLQRLIDRRPPEAYDSEANIRWGKPSSFGFKEDNPNTVTTTVNFPPVEPDEEEDYDEEVTVDFLEVFREETEERRVENPDDSDQYVMVKDVTVIVFEGPDMRPDEMVGREGRKDKIYYRYTFVLPEE